MTCRRQVALGELPPAEIACSGTGKLLLNGAALDRLQALRDRLGKPLIVRSAYRSSEHNRAVGGAKRSKHMEGTAFDIAMLNHDPAAFEAAAREAGFLGFGRAADELALPPEDSTIAEMLSDYGVMREQARACG